MCQLGLPAGAAFLLSAPFAAFCPTPPPPLAPRWQAGWLLCLLSSERILSSEAFVASGVLQALLDYGWRRQSTAQEETAWALGTLSVESTYARVLAADLGALRLLVSLLGGETPPVRLQAAWAVANLSMIGGTPQRLQSVGVTSFLIDGLATDDEGLVHQCARCLGTCLTFDVTRRELVADGDGTALLLLLRLCRSANTGIADASLRALAHAVKDAHLERAQIEPRSRFAAHAARSISHTSCSV